MIAQIVGAVAGAGLVGVGWGLTEAQMFALRRFEVPVLAPGEAPIRVLHVADLHLLPQHRRKQRWVRELARLEPDLVVNTGDNLATPEALDSVLAALDPLLERPGVFVFGSNDYYGPVFKNPFTYLWGRRKGGTYRRGVTLPTEELRAGLTGRGWVDLTNTTATLTLAGREVDFRGTDDAHYNLDRYGPLAGPVDADRLTIGVTHAPYLRVLDAMAADRVDLIMAGHTHGGQVCLPVKGALVTNCDLEPARAKGLHRHPLGPAEGPDQRLGATGAPSRDSEASWLHVSAGLGSSPYAPVRTFCRPEASLLTLVPRS